MKKLQKILASVLALCMLGGCTIANRQDNAKPTAAIQALELPLPSRVSFCAEPADPSITSINGIAVDNTTPLEQCLTTAYPLQELQDFFGTESWEESFIFHTQQYWEDPEYRENLSIQTSLVRANERFPVEVLRCTIARPWDNPEQNPKPCAYTAYPVQEGGLYFVLWRESLYTNPEVYPDEPFYDLHNTFYIPELPTLDTCPIPEVDQDTYADVRAADPLSDFVSLSGVYYSVTILRSGYWLVGYYERQLAPDDPMGQQLFTASDLLLTELIVCEPIRSWVTDMQSIFYGDLF